MSSVLLTVVLAGTSFAQTFDGHGPAPSVDAGRVGTPTLLPAPSGIADGSLAVGLLGEMASTSSVRRFMDVTELRQDRVVGLVAGSNVQATYGLSKRIGVGASMPVWFAAEGPAGIGGPAVGDLRLSAPIGVVLPDVRGRGGALLIQPGLRLPTGSTQRYLGDPGVALGTVVAGGWSNRFVGGGANLDVEWESRTGPPEWPGGLQLGGGAWAGAVLDDWGVQLEWRATRPLAEASVSGVDVGLPSELFVTARTRGQSGWFFSTGIGTALSSGVGAPAVRGFAGVGFAMGEAEELFREPEPEFIPKYVEAKALDPDGFPVRGAEVFVASQLVGTTDADGLVFMHRRIRAGTELLFVRDGMADATAISMAAGEGVVDATLGWLPVAFELRVADSGGESLDATVTFDGTSPVTEASVDDVGTRLYSLPPGEWRLVVGSEGMGTQERTVTVPAGRRDKMRVDVVLFPAVDGGTRLTLSVAGPDGDAVETALVRIDGKIFGTTGSGGDITVTGLKKGNVEVLVGSDSFADGQAQTVRTDGEGTTDVVLDWLPGSVKVVAKGPDGRVTDAMVQLVGPARLPPVLLGPDGSRVFTLREGIWTLLVSSPALGMQEREFELVGGTGDLLLVEVVLLPGEYGEAELAIRVLDADGRAIDGAQVVLGGLAAGATSTRGNLRLRELDPGDRQLTVTSDQMRPYLLDLNLVAGVQERDVVLRWLPGSVQLRAQDAVGQPIDALVLAAGPGSVPPTQLGRDGEHLFTLDAGEWELLISSDELGMQARDVVVPDDHDRLIDVRMGLDAPESSEGASLQVRVLGPDEQPLEGAVVSLDERVLGTTGSVGTLRVGDLAPGERTVVVERLAMARSEQRVTLTADAAQETAEIAMGWGVGSLQVKVDGPTGPVTDALIGIAAPGDVRPPVMVGSDGKRIFSVPSNSTTWVLVSSPTLGVQEKPVPVSDIEQLTTVRFMMRPFAAETAVLLLIVRDDQRQPMAGIPVHIDGELVGETSPGGVVLAEGLSVRREVEVFVDAPEGRIDQTVQLDLAAGSQQRTVVVPWQLATASFTILDQDSNPVDAEVTFQGPAWVPPRRVGPDGLEDFALRPGQWTALASHPELGVAERRFEVPIGGQPMAMELSLKKGRTVVTGNEIAFGEPILFAVNDSALPEAAFALLDEVALRIKADTSIVRLEVQGHTDSTGDAEYNRVLSEQRAESVRLALVERGVAPERLKAMGYGLRRPLTSNDTSEGRALNRRVVFAIVERLE